MQKIAKESVIGKVILQKGIEAAEIMKKFFCIGKCWTDTTLKLEHIAHLAGKEDNLPVLLKELNKLPDRNETATITDCLTIRKIINKKGPEAGILIHERFKPKGGSVSDHLTLWRAAELCDKVPCLQALISELNKMPDLSPAE